MNKIIEHSSFILFLIIALIICKISKDTADNIWIVSIISSVIGGIIVDFLTPSIATAIKKVSLKSQEKMKVMLQVKKGMRSNINRIHDNTSKAAGIIISLVADDPNNKKYGKIDFFLKKNPSHVAQ